MTRIHRNRLAAGILGALLLGAALALVVRSRAGAVLEPSSGTALRGAPLAARLQLLENSLRAIEDGLAQTPRDRWDPQYVLQTVGNDPTVLFNWVRDNTAWIPYRGMLRGAVGVLMDRQGNTLDRAVLLATLLQASGRTVRFAHLELPRERALALLPDLAAATVSADAAKAPTPSVDLARVASEYRLGGPTIDEMLKRQRHAVSATKAEINARVADQVQRLLRALPSQRQNDDWTRRFETAVDSLRDHWWVQAQEGGAWVDFDLFAGGFELSTPGREPALISSIAELPRHLWHELAVRLVVEHWHSGQLAETRVFDHTLTAAEFSGQTLALQIWPGDWPKEMNPDPNGKFGFKDLALQQKRWGATLRAGDHALADGMLSSEGGQVQRGDGGSGGLRGLGGAITGMAESKPSAAAREMTATWIEYEIRTPGQPVRTIRRPIFDLLGPAKRSAGVPSTLVLDEDQKLHRSLALMFRAEILPVTSRLAPEYVAHLTSRSLVANKDLLRMLARVAASGESPDTDALQKAAAPTVSPLLSLAFARLDWSPFASRLFVDQVGVLSRHSHPATAANGIGMRGATDIVSGDIGVTLAQPNAFPVRVAQGIVDSNAEALWWMGASPMNTAEAFNSQARWEVITPAEKERVAQLRFSGDDRARITKDLDDGLMVVAPPEPATLGSEHFAAWWRIDRATGRTTGVSGATTGSCGPEYNLTLRAVMLEAAEEFFMETVLCHGMAQAFNQFVGIMAEVQRAGYFAWWTPQLAGAADPLKVAKDNAGICLVGAIMKGMLSTTALLPFLVRGAEESEAAIVAAQSRQTLLSVDNFIEQSRRLPAQTGPVGIPGRGGTLPEGVIPDTLVEEPVPPTPRAPRTAPPTSAEIARAREAVRIAQQESRKAFEELLAYRDRYPPEGWKGMKYQHPNYSEVVDEALGDEMLRKHFAHQQASAELEALMEAAKNAPPVGGPNLYQIAAGQAGVSASQFWEVSWSGR